MNEEDFKILHVQEIEDMNDESRLKELDRIYKLEVQELRLNTIKAVAKDLLGYVASDYIRVHNDIGGEHLDRIMRNTFILAKRFVEECEKYQ